MVRQMASRDGEMEIESRRWEGWRERSWGDAETEMERERETACA